MGWVRQVSGIISSGQWDDRAGGAAVARGAWRVVGWAPPWEVAQLDKLDEEGQGQS